MFFIINSNSWTKSVSGRLVKLTCPWWCQVVELDFLYPSEGIHRRWENGYRITSMAATPDQAAFILSIPRRKMMDETQETLRTSAFPSTHVKVRTFFSFWRFLSFVSHLKIRVHQEKIIEHHTSVISQTWVRTFVSGRGDNFDLCTYEWVLRVMFDL